MSPFRRLGIALLLLFTATGAFASWYDDYDAGINAANKGQWNAVIQKMSAAIAAHPKEGDKERTYGAIFITYHPYYYRGVAYLNTGKFEQAISDFEKTSGPGDTNLGDLNTLMQRAKTKLEAASAPPPEPTPQPQPQIAQRPAPQPVAPAPVPVPAGPSIDPALRQRVQAAIGTANASLGNARNRKAGGSPQYAQAMQALAEANAKASTAKSNDDLNAALASAQNASLFADSAMAPGVPPKPVQTASAVPPRPVVAADMALSDYRSQLRTALSSYFAGEFDTAARGFESLSRSMPNNGWVWAFLGASRYSQYAFEADDSYKSQAVEAFRRAKSSPNFRKGGLPEKYFSKRIRKFFDTLG